MKSTKSAKRKQALRHQTPDEGQPRLLLAHLLKGLGITLACGAGILLAFSLIAYFCADPGALILPLGLIGAGMTALIGGIVTAKLHRRSALFCGLCNGCLLLSLMMILSLFFPKDGIGYSTGISCALHAGIPILSVVGAYLGLPKSTPRKHRK